MLFNQVVEFLRFVIALYQSEGYHLACVVIMFIYIQNFDQNQNSLSQQAMGLVSLGTHCLYYEIVFTLTKQHILFNTRCSIFLRLLFVIPVISAFQIIC